MIQGTTKNLTRMVVCFVLLLIVGFIMGCERNEPPRKAATSAHGGHDESIAKGGSGTTSGGEIMADRAPVVPGVNENTKKIKYWTCVMHPSVKMPDPGSCPVCKMDLIPIYEGSGLVLTEIQKALIPIRTEPIAFRKLSREIRTVGALDYNETRVTYASTRISGWIEDLHVDFTGINVRKGDELLTIYSPELVAAQEEYLTALKSVDELKNTQFADLRRAIEQTLGAAKSKLELYGLTPAQIENIREHGEVRTALPLYTPSTGTVIHMNVNEGQHVDQGMNLYRIADLSSLWIMADVYEYELPWVYMGQAVEITAQSMPGQTFHGEVTYIYPFFDAPTRTQKVQVGVNNPDGRLRPGMYVTLRMKPTLAEIYAREAHPKEPYACPMHPWMTSATRDECAICGMDLESTRPGLAATGEMKNLPWDIGGPQRIWTCPMHLQIQEDKPGECEVCGMDLIEKNVPLTTDTDVHDHAASPNIPLPSLPPRPDPPPLVFKYACPNHPDEYATVPGQCPLDKVDLVMTGEVLVVPKTAVIDTGLRQVVYVDRGESGYEQIEVELGPEAWAEMKHNGQTTKRRYYPIVKGLNLDDPVVTNGNFLLDSQTQLTGSAAGAYGGALGERAQSSAPGHRH